MARGKIKNPKKTIVTEADREEIRRLWNAGINHLSIAAELNMTPKRVWTVILALEEEHATDQRC